MQRLRGYSLLELVITSLIVGILAAVALPYMVNFRTEAENLKIQSIAQQFQNGLMEVNSRLDNAPFGNNSGVPGVPVKIVPYRGSFVVYSNSPYKVATSLASAGTAATENMPCHGFWNLLVQPDFLTAPNVNALPFGTRLSAGDTPVDTANCGGTDCDFVLVRYISDGEDGGTSNSCTFSQLEAPTGTAGNRFYKTTGRAVVYHPVVHTVQATTGNAIQTYGPYP